METQDKSESNVPENRRRSVLFAVLPFAILLAAIGLVSFVAEWEEKLHWLAIFFIPPLLYGGKRLVTHLSQMSAESRLEGSQQLEKIVGTRWVRYPVAVGAIWLGIFCAFEWTHKLSWVVAAFLWFMAAGLIWEVLLWVIGFGVLALVVWGVSAGIASLPISLAIVLGAAIIAFAIKSRH